MHADTSAYRVAKYFDPTSMLHSPTMHTRSTILLLAAVTISACRASTPSNTDSMAGPSIAPKQSDADAQPSDTTPASAPKAAETNPNEAPSAAPAVAASTEGVQLTAADGVTLFADLHQAATRPNAPIIILFHQAKGSARGEYGPIIPRLIEAGYHVLAVDQRSGGDRFGDPNRTVQQQGKNTGYCEAYPDLEAALAYPPTVGLSGPRVVWGSSYSAGLVLRLAADHASDIAAVLAFSPASGAPMKACEPLAGLSNVRAPVLALRPASEAKLESVQKQIGQLQAAGVQVHVADPGVHGSSMLVAERVAGDTEPTWKVVLEFLARVGADKNGDPSAESQ